MADMVSVLRAGYGFPTTFGLVIASIFAAIAIQLFVIRDRRRAEKVAGDIEEVARTEQVAESKEGGRDSDLDGKALS